MCIESTGEKKYIWSHGLYKGNQSLVPSRKPFRLSCIFCKRQIQNPIRRVSTRAWIDIWAKAVNGSIKSIFAFQNIMFCTISMMSINIHNHSTKSPLMKEVKCIDYKVCMAKSLAFLIGAGMVSRRARKAQRKASLHSTFRSLENHSSGPLKNKSCIWSFKRCISIYILCIRPVMRLLGTAD